MKSIALATIETEVGEMTISLDSYSASGKRTLMGRTESGEHENELADQPDHGYAEGNEGILQAIEDLKTWYSDYRTWKLNLLVDWRDYSLAKEQGGAK